MVPETDKIVAVGKRHDAACIVFWHGKKEAQRALDTLAKPATKAVKDQVGVLFTYSRVCVTCHLVTQGHIVQRKHDGGAMREMRDDHRIWYTSVLVHHNHVRHTVRSGRRCQLRHGISTTIEPCRVGKHQPQLFGELREP